MGYGDSLATLMAMGIAACVVVVLIGLVFYCLKSIGLYTLAKNRGIENPWLAWIPVADLYIMGMLLGEMDLFGLHIENLGLWCPVAVVGGSLLGGIPVLGMLISIALMIFLVAFVYKLFELYTENAILFTILSVLLGLFPIFIFVIRDNEMQVSAPVTDVSSADTTSTISVDEPSEEIVAEPDDTGLSPEEPESIEEK